MSIVDVDRVPVARAGTVERVEYLAHPRRHRRLAWPEGQPQMTAPRGQQVHVRLELPVLGQVEEEVAALGRHAPDAPARLALVGSARIRAGDHGQEDDVRPW